MKTTIRSPSRLLDYLPVIYRDDPFVGQFLLAFEKLLLGFEGDRLPEPKDTDPELAGLEEGDRLPKPEDSNSKTIGLEVQIANIATYFDPLHTPKDFLPWLASWTALTLRADLDPLVQRQFIANIMRYYRFRGTKANLQELLSLFVGGTPTIEENSDPSFTVKVVLPRSLLGKPDQYKRQLEIISTLIELEKPAHTTYKVNPVFPGTIQVGVLAKVGIDTVLGTMPSTQAPSASTV